MSQDAAYQQFTDAAQESLAWFQNEVALLRTGRVKTNLVESLAVEHYGARTPLQGLASITISDARTLVIAPWDPSALAAIQKAIIDAQVGVQPVVDGKIIRLSFPQQNEEMRGRTIKQLHKKAEEARVRLRQARDTALALLKKDKQGKDITEDDFYEGKKKLDEMIDQANRQIEALVTGKEEEIRTL
ncbi:MAG: ribosome recycling factor [Candidatus Andersenbacteria bacterium]